MRHIYLAEVGSTNTYIKERLAEFEPPLMVSAGAQTAGRGQRGNTWEAGPGLNLTLSMLLRPEGVPAPMQFSISEAVALAVVDTLGLFGIQAKVKWPNDIYVGDRKICGILIEHSLYGSLIRSTIAGIGLNVNQREFLSDAPNPVSMRQLAGRDFRLDDVRGELGRLVLEKMEEVSSEEGRAAMHRRFLGELWRGDGKEWPFRDTAGGERFYARIAGIEPDGMLRLRPGSGAPERRYAFKEVSFLLT